MVDLIVFVLDVIALVIIGLSIRDYKTSSVGATFIYFFTGTALFGLIRAFIYLTESEVLPADMMTVMYWWHVMFYLSMICFMVAGRSLAKLVSPAAPQVLFRRAILVSVVFALVAAAVFASVTAADPIVLRYLKGTFWDWSGFPHFVAFTLAGAVAFYMLQVRNAAGRAIVGIVTPLLTGIAFFSLAHLFELLTESWHVIMLDETIGENFEGIIWSFGLAALVVAFSRFRFLSRHVV